MEQNFQNIITKLTILILIGLISIQTMSAQGWRSPASEDSGNCLFRTAIAPTNDGGFLGASIYLDTIQQINSIRIHKVDQDGLELWYKNLPNSTNRIVTDMISCSDGNFLITGEREDDGFCLKIDIYGNILWEYTVQIPTTTVHLKRVIESTTGGYLFTGHTNLFNWQPYLLKLDATGAIVWETNLTTSGKGADLIENPDNTIVVAGTEKKLNTFEAVLYKYDSSGNLIWTSTSIANEEFVSLKRSTTGYFVASSYSNNNTLLKFDFNGSLLWTKGVGVQFPFKIEDLQLTSDGVIVIGPKEYDYDAMVVKMDTLGFIMWYREIEGNMNLHRGVVTSDDEIVCSGVLNGALTSQIVNGPNYTIEFFISCSPSSSGIRVTFDHFHPNALPPYTFTWSNGATSSSIDVGAPGIYSLSITDVNGLSYGGQVTVVDAPPTSLELVKLDQGGALYSNIISGNVFKDSTKDCTFTVGEHGLDQYVIDVSGDAQFTKLTDINGDYRFDVDSGSYTITTILPNQYYENCTPDSTFTVDYKDSMLIDMPIKTLIDCPYMNVYVNSTPIRRCLNSYYSIHYCNDGTVTAHNSWVEVTLDTSMIFMSSSFPITIQSGNTYSFNLGSVAPQDCGSFSITVLNSCHIAQGQAICAQVHIYPDSICIPPLSTWNGSITDLQVACQTDSVTFTIENIGTGPTGTLNYYAVEDNVILKNGTFTLSPSQTEMHRFPSNGSTYRFYAEQAPGFFPDGYKPTTAIEGCGLNSSGTFSQGFINAFPETDDLNYLKEYCQTVVGPYDPNDKSAIPTGVGPNHIVEANTDLNYLIRFQNVGTDTAFNVVIRDTISQELNLSSIKQTGASHAYRLEIVGNNVLKFIFPDIELVDSTTNEPGSHGYVTFKISQEENLPIGTVINNSAAIYFDFEAPVITNQTWHEVGIVFIELPNSVEEPNDLQQFTVKVIPNPVNIFADIVIDAPSVNTKTISVCDAMGRNILSESFENNSYRIYKNQLPTGMYFFTISDEQQAIHSGKFIIK